MADLTRTVSVVPQIVEAPLESPARGFTEVKIVGVGGGGNETPSTRMVETGVQGVEFIAVNTDNQALPDVLGNAADRHRRTQCEKGSAQAAIQFKENGQPKSAATR